jgi:signal transduction histidine kinase/ligand-binding sensor domain-containing protein
MKNKLHNPILFSAIILLVCSIAMPLYVRSQIGSIRFNSVSTAHGLSHESVNTVVRDATGYMWFGTRSGLNRWDGYDMEVFQNNPYDSTSICNSEIHSSFCMSSGELWFGTRDGLALFNAQNETFQNFHPPGLSKEAVRITCLIEDNQHTLWIGTSFGLFIKRISDESLQPVSTLLPALAELDSISITDFFDAKDKLYITSGGAGLWEMNTSTLQVEQWTTESEGWKKLHSDKVRFVTTDHQNNLWLAYYDCTVERRDMAIQSVLKVTELSEYIRGDMKSEMGDLVVDHEGNIWASSSLASVSVFDNATQSFQHLKDKPYITAFDNTRSARSIYVDKNGTIWLAMHTTGVLYFNLSKQPFIHYARLDGLPDTEVDSHLLSNWTRAFAEDNSKQLWTGTTDGVSILNRETQTFTSLRNKTATDDALANNSIRSILNIDNRYMLIGTAGGLTRYNFDTGKSINYYADSKNPQALRGDFVLDIQQGIDGSIYLATSNGFTQYDGQTETFYNWADIPELHKEFGESMRCMSIEKDGIIWIGKSNGNLLEFRFRENKITEYEGLQSKYQHLDNTVLDIINDGGVLWLGTLTGLLKFDKQTKQFSRVSFHEKSTPLMVGNLQRQGKDILWFTGTTGLVKYHISLGTAEYFTVHHGLPTNSFHFQRSYITHDGLYCMASMKGIVMFRPDNLNQLTIFPKAYITRLRVLNEEKDLTRMIEPKLSLAYNENFFTLTLNTFDFLNEENIQYASMLEGLHDDWVYHGKNRQLSFTNVPGGDYVLKYKATTSDGVWPDEFQILHIHIDTAFYKTWWFTILMILFSIAIVYAIMKYRQQQKHKVENLLQKIARDLHDDIGATLSSIRMYSEVARTRPGDNVPLLDRISENARGMVDSMSDIVWAIKPGNDKFGDLKIRMENFANEMCGPLDIELKLNYDAKLDDLKLHMEQRKDLYLIFKEAVNNAVKYSECKNLSITLKREDNSIRIEISDNGKGFDLEKIKKGNGLDNMRMRVAAMKGRLQVTSSQAEGTCILFDVPYTHFG